MVHSTRLFYLLFTNTRLSDILRDLVQYVESYSSNMLEKSPTRNQFLLSRRYRLFDCQVILKIFQIMRDEAQTDQPRIAHKLRKNVVSSYPFPSPSLLSVSDSVCLRPTLLEVSVVTDDDVFL